MVKKKLKLGDFGDFKARTPYFFGLNGNKWYISHYLAKVMLNETLRG